MNESSFTGTPSRQAPVKRIGYHRSDDDSISSAVLNPMELDARLADILRMPTVDKIWTRDERDEIDFEWRRLYRVDSEFKIRTPDGRWVTFSYTAVSESIHCPNTGATFDKYSAFGKPRWRGELGAIGWALAYVKLGLV